MTSWLKLETSQVTLYLESIDASTICPHVFSGSEKNTRIERILPAEESVLLRDGMGNRCHPSEGEMDPSTRLFLRLHNGELAFVQRGSTKFTTSQEF